LKEFLAEKKLAYMEQVQVAIRNHGKINWLIAGVAWQWP
jgi:hypothetical protein